MLETVQVSTNYTEYLLKNLGFLRAFKYTLCTTQKSSCNSPLKLHVGEKDGTFLSTHTSDLVLY